MYYGYRCPCGIKVLSLLSLCFSGQNIIVKVPKKRRAKLPNHWLGNTRHTYQMKTSFLLHLLPFHFFSRKPTPCSPSLQGTVGRPRSYLTSPLEKDHSELELRNQIPGSVAFIFPLPPASLELPLSRKFKRSKLLGPGRAWDMRLAQFSRHWLSTCLQCLKEAKELCM